MNHVIGILLAILFFILVSTIGMLAAYSQQPSGCDAQCRAQRATINELTQAWVGARTAMEAAQEQNAALQGEIKKLKNEREAETKAKVNPLPDASKEAPSP